MTTRHWSAPESKIRILFALCCASFAGSQAVYAAVAFPLKLSQDQRYLEDQNGTPFPLIGDAPWTLAVDLTPGEVTTYLNDRQTKGFTAILLELIETGFGGPRNQAGQHPFAGGDADWRVRNELYWQHIDWIIDEAAARDIVVFAFPAYLGYGCSQGWAQEMLSQSTSVMGDYGRWLGARYRDKGNIVWVDGGDVNPGDCAPDPIQHVNALAEGIRAADPKHLHTSHTSRNRVAALDYSSTGLNLYSAYSDCDSAAIRVRDEYQRVPAKPVFHIEGGYENDSASLACLVAQPLWAFLGGAPGHFFGNNPIWLFDPGWQSALQSLGSRGMWYVSKLIRSRPWWLFEPDYIHLVVTAGYGSVSDGSYVGAARVRNGASVIAYIPSAAQRIKVDMTKISGANARGWWYFPQSGAVQDLGSFPTSSSREFVAPETSSVLVLDDASQGFPPPGNPWTELSRPSPPVNVRVIEGSPQ